MSIAENAVREAVAQTTKTLEQMLASAEQHEADFARGQASGIRHSLELVRNLFFDYRPCGCGNPSVGPDITGAPICAPCANEIAHQIRETGLSPIGIVPTQPTGADR